MSADSFHLQIASGHELYLDNNFDLRKGSVTSVSSRNVDESGFKLLSTKYHKDAIRAKHLPVLSMLTLSITLYFTSKGIRRRRIEREEKCKSF